MGRRQARLECWSWILGFGAKISLNSANPSRRVIFAAYNLARTQSHLLPAERARLDKDRQLRATYEKDLAFINLATG